MAEAGDRKEWVTARHTPTGTVVKVSLVEGAASASATVKAYTVTIKEAVASARSIAEKMLADLQEAMA